MGPSSLIERLEGLDLVSSTSRKGDTCCGGMDGMDRWTDECRKEEMKEKGEEG